MAMAQVISLRIGLLRFAGLVAPPGMPAESSGQVQVHKLAWSHPMKM